MNNSLNKILLALATVVVITACSPKASTEDTSAQTKAIVDQAVAETKKQMLADQAAEKAKQEAQVAEEAAAKAKQDAAVAQAVADAKKENAAKQQAAAKALAHKPSPPAAPIGTTSAASANTAAAPATPSAPVSTAPKKMVCTTCGTVVAIAEVEVEGKGSGLGVVAGGVVGGLLGNQIGNGSGRDLATIAGAIGGAMAGNKIEKNSKKVKNFNVTVKMETGEEVVYHLATAPAFAKGDAVRIENNTVIKQ